MIRCFLAFVFGFLAATSAAASDKGTDAFWRLLLEGNIPALERELDSLQAAVVAGTRSAEEQRAVYTLFATTHPGVIALLRRWLAEDPTSIHARAGAMWQAHHVAWREQAVVFSVYRLSVLDDYLRSAKNTVLNMSLAIERADTEWYGTAFSPEEVAEIHGCAMVRAARLIGFCCERGEAYAHTCRAAQDALEMAREGEYCVWLQHAEPQALALPDASRAAPNWGLQTMP